MTQKRAPLTDDERDRIVEMRGPVIGVYGGHARRRAASHGGRGTRDVWEGGHVAACSEAMGIDWMTLSEISEAIPPAFTRFLAEEFEAWRWAERLGLVEPVAA